MSTLNQILLPLMLYHPKYLSKQSQKKAFAMVFNKVGSNKHTLTSYKPISVPYTFQYLFLNLAYFKQYGIQHMFLCLLEELRADINQNELTGVVLLDLSYTFN